MGRAAIEHVSPLQFQREYVSGNKPVVITGAIDHWPALQLWNSASLAAAAGDTLATVAITPDGRADAPALLPDGTPVFALPLQQRMTLAEFFRLLRWSSRGGRNVPYLQYQNSSLTAELPELLGDVDRELPWASEAFGECKASPPLGMPGCEPRDLPGLHRCPRCCASCGCASPGGASAAAPRCRDASRGCERLDGRAAEHHHVAP